NWGNKPTQIYPLKLKLDLAIAADSIRVYPLDVRGQELESTAKTYKPSAVNHFLVELDQSINRTLWFGVKKFGSGTVGIEESLEIPTKTELMQNYPNPFNPETMIRFTVQASSKVSLKIYDVLGREIVTLMDEYKAAGNYEVNFNSSHFERSREMASGIYFYKLSAGNYSSVKKMIFLK
ncbi:MAG: T9SS type A sorting domain-containing protein, partial [Melioribacteraceae bacterium]